MRVNPRRSPSRTAMRRTGSTVHARLLLHLLHRHLRRRVADVGPSRGVEPHARVGPLHQEDLARLVAHDRPDGHLGRHVPGHALPDVGQPLIDQGVGVGPVAGGDPDVGRHPQDLLEALPLVEAGGEAEAGAGDGGQRLAPSQQVLSGNPAADLQITHRNRPYFGSRSGKMAGRERQGGLPPLLPSFAAHRRRGGAVPARRGRADPLRLPRRLSVLRTPAHQRRRLAPPQRPPLDRRSLARQGRQATDPRQRPLRSAPRRAVQPASKVSSWAKNDERGRTTSQPAAWAAAMRAGSV